MLRTLLTPLRSRFDISPLSPRSAPLPPENEDELAPEDFARDVLIQLMRNSVDNLKTAENATARDEVLTEIQRIMLQESRTKDVFRELDGFLVLMSVLSAIQASDEIQQVLEGTRLVFMILSEAMHEHYQNEEYFAVSVGYESLAHALYALVSDPRTVDESMGFLFSLALHDFALSGLFTTLRHLSEDDIELKLTESQPRLGLIHRPGAIAVLWSFIPHLYATDTSMRYAVFKLFELLSQKSHRNHALLSTLGLVSPLLEHWTQVKNGSGSEKERHVLQKLLKRLLEMGATTAEARSIFQQTVKEDDTLDPDVLDIVRAGIKSRWVEHISMESRARLVITQEHVKGLPSTGFTFTMWFWIENHPKETHTLFTIRVPSRNLIVVSLRQDGHLQLLSSANRDIVVLEHSAIQKARWTHFALVHYPQRDKASSNRTIRIFLDGVLTESLNWTYPRPETSYNQTIEYLLGDDASETKLSWCLASAHLLSIPLVDDILRLIHHLGARYSGNFQDPGLINFLTYEATTSINIFLFSVGGGTASTHVTTTKNGKTNTIKPPVDSLPLMKAAREGLSIPQSTILFSLVPVYTPKSGRPAGQVLLGTTPGMSSDGVWKVYGDVVVIKAATIDMALWKIGGATVGLRLVQLANTQHELSRAIGVLIDGLKNSWQNSDDMERLRGYEVLADILRSKAHLINITSFETLFEFLGISFRSPEQSTVVNVYAYKALALDFELWSRTRPEIQRVHFEQFVTALRTSRYKKYNARQPFAKMGLVRRFLFVLQTDWYHHDMLRHLVDTLKIITQANFSRDDAIKPLVTYLAANLHDEGSVVASPASYVSRIDYKDIHEKAEMVLDLLTSTLSIPVLYTKFTTTLPLTRICLLLLGDKPSPFIASQILTIIAISMNVTASFSRKFELISGWSVLKTVLPSCWDPTVHEAALDVLLGRVHGQSSQANGNGNAKRASTTNEIVCPAIVPTILAALQTGLVAAGNNCQASDDASYSTPAESTMEVLIEELIDLHTSSAAFRQIFESQQTTKLFVDAYKRFVQKVASVEVNQRTMRLIEKLNHLGLALALDNAVAGSQKREILDTLRIAEAVLNPSAEKTMIDPGLVADTRSIRQRIASVRLSIQVGERTVMKTITRMVDWRKSIQVSERKRLRKGILDLREDRRQISRLYDWTIFLTSERGLWQRHETQLWRLDETEGPHRIRKKLEPQCEKPASRVEAAQEPIRAIQAPESETNSVLQVEIPPWNESYEISSTEVEDRQLAEDITEDKHLRVRHELEPGDVIDAIATVARVAGVDSSPGLLILGRTHLYMLDGLVESEDGEVIEAKEAPRRLFFVPGSIVELDGPQKAQRWTHHQIASFSTRTFLFRDVGLELYFKDSRSLLIVFLEKEIRADVEQRLTTIIGRTDALLTPGPQRTPRLGKLGVKLGFREDELATAQHKWQAREISNFTYLCILNQVSGRTSSDATQYPVFPWVLQDYTSQTLELSSDVYRDLSKPMGAMTDVRREAAQTRYRSLQSVEEKPFHYGTHFSSSMIVCHFLIRMAPFTNMFKTLQGGDWDLPDRLFSDIARAYESAAHDVRGDVRELIPEFFTCPEFLENSANLDFGVQQNNGERIHDVKLPPWARQDPLLFVIMNRRALESQYVSDHLPEWIDLIWGCKQGDPEALNVFHPLSYEGAIDLDSITDDLEREATVGIIHNFGQTPRKLFNTPHPNRFTHGPLTLPIGTLHGIEEDPHLLNQGSKCFKDLGPTVAVRELAFDMVGEKIIPCPEGVLIVPLHPHEEVEWGFNRVGGDELRLLVDHKVVQVVEGAFCTCASFADPDSLVTGSSDHTVRLWKLLRNHPHYGPLHVGLSHILRGHTERVTCVTACRPWSIIVSGSEDGSAALWCLNRGTYIRSIWHRDSGDTNSASRESTVVNLVAVNESTGYIATCSTSKLMLHSVNARPMAVLDLTSLSPICSLAFHEREYSPLGILATGAADGTITLRTWTADGTSEGEKAKWEFLDVRKMKTRAAHLGRGGPGRPPAVTALKFLGESLCHGEETGKAYLWTLPD